jgi:hypothetical protein
MMERMVEIPPLAADEEVAVRLSVLVERQPTIKRLVLILLRPG